MSLVTTTITPRNTSTNSVSKGLSISIIINTPITVTVEFMTCEKLCESINGGSQLYPIEVFPASFGEEGVAMGAYSLGAEQALDVIARDVTE